MGGLCFLKKREQYLLCLQEKQKKQIKKNRRQFWGGLKCLILGE